MPLWHIKRYACGWGLSDLTGATLRRESNTSKFHNNVLVCAEERGNATKDPAHKNSRSGQRQHDEADTQLEDLDTEESE